MKIFKRFAILGVVLATIIAIPAMNTAEAQFVPPIPKDHCTVRFFPTHPRVGPIVEVTVPQKAACKLAEIHIAITRGCKCVIE